MGAVSPELLFYLLKLLVCGPIAESYWEACADETLLAIQAREPILLGESGVRGRWWVEEGTNRVVLHLNACGGVNRWGYRAQFRIDRREDRSQPAPGSALELAMGRWRIRAGPTRGGLGAGLLVGERVLAAAGAEVRSAWTGVPTKLRVGPVSKEYPRPRALALQYEGRQQVTVALLEEIGSLPFLVAEWRPTETVRAVLLHSRETFGAEAVVGSRDGIVLWRLCAAGWRGENTGRGYSVEAVVSSRSRQACWEARLWSWIGDRPPLASPLPGATNDRRIGGRLAVELEPVRRLRAAASLETAIDRGSSQRPWWWRGQILLSRGSITDAGFHLRWRRTVQTVLESWIPHRQDERRLVEMKLRSRSSGRVRWLGALRRESGPGGSASRGIWLQAEHTNPKLRVYIRGTFSLPVAGLPLYWFEPGPIYGWHLRVERQCGIRLLLGASSRPEGWHLQIIAGDRGLAGFKIAWCSFK